MNSKRLRTYTLLSFALSGVGCKSAKKEQSLEPAQGLPVQEPSSRTANHELVKSQPITIVDQSGNAISLVKVLDSKENLLCTTDNRGRCTYQQTTLIGTLLLFKAKHVVHSTVDIGAGNKDKTISVERKHNISFSFNNHHEQGAEVVLNARSTTGPVQSTSFTATTKTATWWLPQGYYSLSMSSKNAMSKRTPIHLIGNQTVDIPTIKGYSVNGKVLGKELPTDGHINFVSQNENFDTRTAKLNVNGTFTISGLPKGKWSAQLFSKNHFSSITPFSIQKDLDNLQIQSEPKYSLSGRVLGANRIPLANVTVTLSTLYPQQNAVLKTMPSLWVFPVAGKSHALNLSRSRRFGAFRSGDRPPECIKGHCGIDIGGSTGLPILAASSGKIIKIQRQDTGLAGRFVKIDHGGLFTTWYIHLDTVAPNMQVGTSVVSGERIGTLGSTGIKKSRPHLHFGLAIKQNEVSTYIDPLEILRRAAFSPGIVNSSKTTEKSHLVAIPLVTMKPQQKNSDPLVTYVKTNKDGRFQLKSLYSKSLALHFSHPDYMNARRVISSVNHHERFVDITLTKFKKQKGKMSFPTLGDSNLHILTEWGSEEALSKTHPSPIGKDGTFEIDVPPLPYTIVVLKGSLEESRFEVNSASFDFFSLQTQKRDKSFKLKMLDPSGLKAHDATVEIFPHPKSSRTFRANDDGHVIVGPLTKNQITVRTNASWSFPLKHVISTSNHWQDIVVPFAMELRVPLRLENGDAPPNGTQMLLAKDEQKLKCFSNNQGNCIFSSTGPGTWMLVNQNKSYAQIQKRIDVGAASSRNQTLLIETLTLIEGVSLSGVVRDEHGDRLSNALITLGNIQTETDLDGFYEFESVQYGSHLLKIARGNQSLSKKLKIEPGNPHRSMDWVLKETTVP